MGVWAKAELEESGLKIWTTPKMTKKVPVWMRSSLWEPTQFWLRVLIARRAIRKNTVFNTAII